MNKKSVSDISSVKIKINYNRHFGMKKSAVTQKKTHNEELNESLSNEREHSGSKPSYQKNSGLGGLNLVSVDSNATTGLDSAHDKKATKHFRRQESRSSDAQHLRMTVFIREMFLEIKQRTIEEVIL